MHLLDVNILVHAFRKDAPDHDRYARWMEQLVNGEQVFGVPDLVLSGFLRIVTHPRIFTSPSSIGDALLYVEQVRSSPSFVAIHPGPRHWDIFCELCRSAKVNGNLVPDAYLAAIAIESDSLWITADRDYHRFPSLRSRHPLVES